MSVGIGVVGYGYWGPNLARNFSEAAGARLVGISDLSPERRAAAQGRFPGVRVAASLDDLLALDGLDAVAIATPVSTHFELALHALQAGKHVLVEKPLAPTTREAQRLVDEAERRGLTLLVDHTFLYSGAIQKVRELVGEGRLGQVYYYDSVRVNLGLFQHDVNVLWDLAVHDLSIMDYVLGLAPTAVAATAVAHVPGQTESQAYLTCFFPGTLLAHLHVNWLAPVKIRQTLIGGDRQMIVYDELAPSDKVRVYDCGVSVDTDPEHVRQVLVQYRTGDAWMPRISLTEALSVEAADFVRSIERGTRPLSDGSAGVRVVRVLEAAALSIAQGGRRVELDEVPTLVSTGAA